MDDVTSGFNIGTNLSLSPSFNKMLGFTEAEVRDLVETYRSRGTLDQDADAAVDVMREWYGGYRFADDAANTLYNPDMVLYYLKESISTERIPRYPVDVNVRVDYGKLRHLLVMNQETGVRQLNGNFEVLRSIAGEGSVDTDINPSFPLD